VGVGWTYPILAAVALQRLAELWLARRNTRALLAAGAVESGARHYPLMIMLHGGWLIAIACLADPDRPPDWGWLALFALLQAGRVWVIASLGRFWTTRVISLPGAPLVRRGPYRWVRHPNYLVVIGEIAALPLAFGRWPVAAIASLANGTLLVWRVRVETLALRDRAA